MAKKVFELYVQYLNSDPSGLGFLEDVDLDLKKELGYSDSSGSGFGARDLQWYFESKKQVESDAEKSRDIFKKHNLKITKNGNMVRTREVTKSAIEA